MLKIVLTRLYTYSYDRPGLSTLADFAAGERMQMPAANYNKSQLCSTIVDSLTYKVIGTRGPVSG